MDEGKIKITILGSGTSSGVPMIGCGCAVCTSDNPKNDRTRSSILISLAGGNILVDTSTDLRQQALRHGIDSINAVLFTHAHADHIHGIDELRSFNFIQKRPIPCYGDGRTLKRIKTIFSYIFDGGMKGEKGWWLPQLEMNEVKGVFDLLGMTLVPVEVAHGEIPVLGYRFGKTAYITDCSSIPDGSLEKLEGLDLLILGALRYVPHSKHFSIEEALAAVEKLKPKRTFFTHMGHDIDYDKTSAELPDGVSLAYDGLVLETE